MKFLPRMVDADRIERIRQHVIGLSQATEISDQEIIRVALGVAVRRIEEAEAEAALRAAAEEFGRGMEEPIGPDPWDEVPS